MGPRRRPLRVAASVRWLSRSRGNFLDTSDSYQFGESESLLGEFIKASRDDLVVATKYTQSADPQGSPSVTGNSRKAMVRSLEASLNRLGTDLLGSYA
jgi:aryl-alcohol dehydrogenase-like predicted oxidoreductase